MVVVENGSKNQVSSYAVQWKSGGIETATSEKCLFYCLLTLPGKYSFMQKAISGNINMF